MTEVQPRTPQASKAWLQVPSVRTPEGSVQDHRWREGNGRRQGFRQQA